MVQLTDDEETILKQFMDLSHISDRNLCIDILQVSGWNIQGAHGLIEQDLSFQFPAATNTLEDDFFIDEDDLDLPEELDEEEPNNSWLGLLQRNWIVQSLTSLYSLIIDFLSNLLRSLFGPQVVVDLIAEEKFGNFHYTSPDYSTTRNFCINQDKPALLYLYEINQSCSAFHRGYLLNDFTINYLNSFSLLLWPVNKIDDLPIYLTTQLGNIMFPSLYILHIAENKQTVHKVTDFQNVRSMCLNIMDVLEIIRTTQQNEQLMAETRQIRLQQEEEYKEALEKDEFSVTEFWEPPAVQVDEKLWAETKVKYRKELPEETTTTVGSIALRIRYPTGRAADRRFLLSDSCHDIYRFAYLHEDAPYRMTISSVKPFKTIPCEPEDGPDFGTIGDLCLSNRSVLVVYDKDA